ncbi:hypothetical protein, partial [Serratia marcescens]|uniref:hypothetical protein n=1 Tax=Serratia marcescens TaxID=615 RepID=UPI001953A3EF
DRASSIALAIGSVNPKELDPVTKAQLYSYIQLGRVKVLIICNTNAVSLDVEKELRDMGFLE